MQDVVTSGDGGGPAFVAVEIGCGEVDLTTGPLGQLDQVLALARVGETAHGAAHRVSVVQQFGDDVPGDEAGGAGDKYSCAHDVYPSRGGEPGASERRSDNLNTAQIGLSSAVPLRSDGDPDLVSPRRPA